MRLILKKKVAPSCSHAHAPAILREDRTVGLWPMARRLSSLRTGVTTRRCKPTPIHNAQVLDARIA